MRGLNRLGTAIVVDIRKALIVNDLRGAPAQVLDHQRLTKALVSYHYTLIRHIYGIYGNSGEISIIKVKGIFYLFFYIEKPSFSSICFATLEGVSPSS